MSVDITFLLVFSICSSMFVIEKLNDACLTSEHVEKLIGKCWRWFCCTFSIKNMFPFINRLLVVFEGGKLKLFFHKIEILNLKRRQRRVIFSILYWRRISQNKHVAYNNRKRKKHGFGARRKVFSILYWNDIL